MPVGDYDNCSPQTGSPVTPEVCTGEVLNHVSGDPCNVNPDPCIKFDQSSGSDLSAVFTVNEPMELLAFGLEHPDYIELEQVWGPNEGTHFEKVVVGGQCYRLTPCTNRLLIPFAGRFRLRYHGEVGNATVVCNPTDCCFASIHPKDCTMACEPPLTNVQLAQMLAFRTCSGGTVLPGESLATCLDLSAAIAALDIPVVPTYYNGDGDPLTDGACLVTCAEFNQEVARLDQRIDNIVLPPGTQYVGTNGNPLPNNACLVQCGEFQALVVRVDDAETDITALSVQLAALQAQVNALDIPNGLDLTGAVLSLVSPNGTMDSVDLSALIGGGGSPDGVVTNVTLSGTDLVFSGTGGGFNGTVDLSSLAGGPGGTGDVTGVAVTGPLTVTDSGGPVPTIGLDIDALVTALCSNQDFAICLANKILTAFDQTGGELVIADGVDANGDFTFTPCP